MVVLLGMRVTHAQLADTYSLPRSANCCLLNTATLLAERLDEAFPGKPYVNPNAQGYTLMTPVASAAIADALRR